MAEVETSNCRPISAKDTPNPRPNFQAKTVWNLDDVVQSPLRNQPGSPYYHPFPSPFNRVIRNSQKAKLDPGTRDSVSNVKATSNHAVWGVKGGGGGLKVTPYRLAGLVRGQNI